tara:strand:+ start:1084 stop:1275 length:192 start_codon:yes stop_codon:yes gene_type:complete
MITPNNLQVIDARKDAKLTQQGAADVLGVHITTWQKWESGQHKMGKATYALFRIKTNSKKIPD